MYNVINTYLDILQDEYSPLGFMYIFILNIEPTSSATCLLQLMYLNHTVKSQNFRIWVCPWEEIKRSHFNLPSVAEPASLNPPRKTCTHRAQLSRSLHPFANPIQGTLGCRGVHCQPLQDKWNLIWAKARWAEGAPWMVTVSGNWLDDPMPLASTGSSWYSTSLSLLPLL